MASQKSFPYIDVSILNSKKNRNLFILNSLLLGGVVMGWGVKKREMVELYHLYGVRPSTFTY